MVHPPRPRVEGGVLLSLKGEKGGSIIARLYIILGTKSLPKLSLTLLGNEYGSSSFFR